MLQREFDRLTSDLPIRGRKASTTSETNDVALIVLEQGEVHLIHQVIAGFDATPTSPAAIEIAFIPDGESETLVFSIPITQPGPAPIVFPKAISPENDTTEVRIRLTAGGSGVIGNLNVLHY
jgi:hypothetical protein